MLVDGELTGVHGELPARLEEARAEAGRLAIGQPHLRVAQEDAILARTVEVDLDLANAGATDAENRIERQVAIDDVATEGEIRGLLVDVERWQDLTHDEQRIVGIGNRR